MSNIQIIMKNTDVKTALPQIDALDMDPRQRNCLRLLAEEMFSMMAAILKVHQATFGIEMSGKEYSLNLKVATDIYEEDRKEFMSISTDGKNYLNRGILGKIGAVTEAILNADVSYPLLTGNLDGYSCAWVMSEYISAAGKEEKKDDWDGLEKSILANFADDILVGLRNKKLEMVVKKSF